SLSALEGVLNGERLARGDCDVPYPCGAFGWLSYDVARELEAFPPAAPDGPGAVDDRGLPRLQAALFDRIAAWECPVDENDEPVTLRVTACPRVPAGLDDPHADRDGLDALFDEGRARAGNLIDRIEGGDPASGPAPDPTAESATF
ncbi:anthranilate synthase component I, partial [Haloferax sp. Atlit-105R]